MDKISDEFVFLPFQDEKIWNLNLELLSSEIKNVDEFVDVLRKICIEVFPSAIEQAKRGLEAYFGNRENEFNGRFFTDILPFIRLQALELPKLFLEPIPRLSALEDKTLILSRKQIASLLANAFFCTFNQSELCPQINFLALYAHLSAPQEAAKFTMIINYFDRISKGVPTGNISFHRQVLKDFPNYSKSEKLITNLTVHSQGSIEDAQGLLQVDFANRSIGGGVLVGGCVQEEIRFSVSTELIAACLFTEFLKENEALIVSGSERFSKYNGYALSLKFGGNYEDPTSRDDNGNIRSYIVAIDAMDYSFLGKESQYQPQIFTREINKAYCGFYSLDENPVAIATGNWGCGAFLGDVEHKSIIQLIAASEAGRELVYYSFGKESFSETLISLTNTWRSQGATVAHLWKLLNDYSKEAMKPNPMGFFDFITHRSNHPLISALQKFKKKIL